MKNILVIASFFLICLSAFGSNFDKGVKEYNSGNFETALILFNQELGEGNNSAGLYNNLGRTYFELDSLGKAVWAYQMALKYDPSNDKTIANLEFLESKIKDDVALYERSLLRWFEGMAFGRNQNFWVYAGVLFSLFLSLLILIKFRTKNNLVRTFSFYGSWFFGVLLSLSIVLSYYHSNRLETMTKGVVVNKKIEIYSNPTSSASSIASLNEGAVFDITNSTDGFIGVELGEIQGWVHADEVWQY